MWTLRDLVSIVLHLFIDNSPGLETMAPGNVLTCITLLLGITQEINILISCVTVPSLNDALVITKASFGDGTAYQGLGGAHILPGKRVIGIAVEASGIQQNSMWHNSIDTKVLRILKGWFSCCCCGQ